MLTGVEDVELAVSAMKLGAFDYLTKPVDNDQLLKIITTVLENRKARGAAAAEATVSLDQLEIQGRLQGHHHPERRDDHACSRWSKKWPSPTTAS